MLRLPNFAKKHTNNATEQSVLDSMLNAVVSLYLYMARTTKLRGEELNYIDRLLHSMFGNSIPLYKLEQARSSVLSLRDAESLINAHLSKSDRSKIILNLISLAYHERSKLNILGSLEIVELTDLLRLDVNSLDEIYQLMEGNLDSLSLPDLIPDGSRSYLHNSMQWAASNADFRFVGKDNKLKLTFIMIESMVLLYLKGSSATQQCRKLALGKYNTLTEGVFHHLGADELLILPGYAGDISLTVDNLWHVYNLSPAPIKLQGKEFTLISKNHRFYTESKYGSAKELALDECLAEGDATSVLQFLLKQGEDDSLASSSVDYYLCRDKFGLYIGSEQQASAMLHFYNRDGNLWVKSPEESNIYLNLLPIKQETPFTPNLDIISLNGANYIVNRHWELIEIPIRIDELCIDEVSHSFPGGKTALSNIAFKVPKGSMTAIMGPSGSGKTTLLQVLLGDIHATRSRISIDGVDFNANFPYFAKYIGYVPQDDLLFPNLSVYENLYYRLRLALPSLKNRTEIRTRIENLLRSVGLFEQRHMQVGDVMNKKLSGGQRRRLNIAMELVLNPVIIILDEPTSGLSSKDSENITDFLCDLKEQNKIILCTIHQPNATVFKAFDYTLLLDTGGKQVFFGSSREIFGYFEDELAKSGTKQDALITKRNLQMPDYFFDLVETVDHNGNRSFSPDYWEQKYRNYSFRKTLEQGSQKQESSEQQTPILKRRNKLHFRPGSMLLLVGRNFVNKSRSRINLGMTLLVAPLLAAISSFVLRGTENGTTYSFLENGNALLFGFISVIIFIFIGLANSIDDLLGERRSIQREMKLNISSLCQLISKHLVLLLMTSVQVLLYYHVSALVLGMRGFAIPQTIFLLLSGVTGYALGLLFSSLIKDRSAIVNILPLVIIPQIMFSGAVIRFADMNPALRLNKSREIPEFCHVIPSRWLYEGWVVASARLNALDREKASFLEQAKDTSRSYEQYMKDVNSYNGFLNSHPETRYSNKQLQSTVKLAHGDYLNQARNIFLSHKTMFLGKERESYLVDILVSFFIISLSFIITLLRLRGGFRKL